MVGECHHRSGRMLYALFLYTSDLCVGSLSYLIHIPPANIPFTKTVVFINTSDVCVGYYHHTSYTFHLQIYYLLKQLFL